MDIGIKKELGKRYNKVLEKTKKSFEKNGFGVVEEFNIQLKLEEKLGVSREKYTILAICNPEVAKDLLDLEKEMGLLLPCNVIVYEEEGKVIVSALRPTKVLKITNNNKIKKLATEVEQRIQGVIESI